jgi:hypothetical protein
LIDLFDGADKIVFRDDHPHFPGLAEGGWKAREGGKIAVSAGLNRQFWPPLSPVLVKSGGNAVKSQFRQIDRAQHPVFAEINQLGGVGKGHHLLPIEDEGHAGFADFQGFQKE